MPKEVLGSIRNEHSSNPHVGDMITPSALKGCVRKTVLERTENYYQEPPKLYYAIRGSLIHGFLENHGLQGVESEKRMYKTLTIKGRKII